MLDWHQIDTILLDMDGTLLDLNFDYHFWLEFLPNHYATTNQCDTQEARSKVLKMVQELQGTLNWYCLDYWSEQLQMDIPALKQDVAHLIQERPYTIEFLQWLKQLGKTNILVTNSHPAGVELKFKHSQIEPHLDFIYTSHQFKTPKESPDFWSLFQAHHPFDPARSVLIDDNEQVLQAAKIFGIGHLLTIAQPNLSQPARKDLQFPTIHCYHDLIRQADTTCTIQQP